MVPMRFNTIFKNRWWALVWAAGIIWAAYDFVGWAPQADNSSNAGQATDASGTPVTSDDQRKLAEELNSF